MNIELKNRETEGKHCLSFCRQTAFIATLACACWMIPHAFKEALKKKKLFERCLPTLLPWQLQASVDNPEFLGYNVRATLFKKPTN